MIAPLNQALRLIPAWLIYLCTAAYAGWLFWQGVGGALGPDPVKALEHAYGEAALYMIIAGLIVSPLRRFAGLNLQKFRRAIGLSAFFLVVAHLLVWAILDVQTIARVWADIVKRPYITVGMAGFALMIPLAVTSNDRAVRSLGMTWRKLHWLVYPAALLACVHYVMLVKGWQLRPLIFLGLLLILLALRPLSKRKAKQQTLDT